MTCRFSNALGEPRKGVHEWRFGGDFAGFDFFLTVAVALAIALGYWGKNRMPANRVFVLFSLAFVFLIALRNSDAIRIFFVLHRAFCVPTTTNRWLFAGKGSEYERDEL
jgi:hypothetical protein